MQNSDLLQTPLRESFVSPKSGITLIACGGSFGRVPEEDVLNGTARRVEMRASQDGRGFTQAWHDGPEAESVWAEIWTTDVDGPVCVFHGCVDSVSRKVTQVG